MPHFQLVTNLPRNKIPKNFLSELTAILAITIGKPESKFVVAIITDQLMSWGGNSDQPIAVGRLRSIGKLGAAVNIGHSKVLFDKICTDLGIAKNRLTIEYVDMAAGEVGYDGTTVEELMKAGF